MIYLGTFKNILNRRYRWIEYFEEIGAQIKYIPGGENIITGYISRHTQDESNRLNILGVASLYLSSEVYQNEDVVAEQRDDQQLMLVKEYLEQRGELDFPNSLPETYRWYSDNILLSENGCLKFLRHGKPLVILPETQRQEDLEFWHSYWASGHFGILKTHRRILEPFWSPGMLNDVKKFVEKCEICLKVKP